MDHNNVDMESLVISGISGAYPKSRHIKDLCDILYNKIDPIEFCQNRNLRHPEVLPYAGRVPQVDRFDAQFFKVNNYLAKSMDPAARKVLEHSYRAIYDAGFSIDHLWGQNIGVFIGSSLAEAEKVFHYDVQAVTATSMTGCSKAMFANRISYWMNLKGPSMNIDDTCASSFVALEQAVQAIRRGDCEAALVGGACISLQMQSALNLGRNILLSKDGKVKSFAQDADGSVKSDAVCMIFIQKAKSALRMYAEVVHVKHEFDSLSGKNDRNDDELSGFYCDKGHMVDFLQRFYQETDVSPSDVEYVEAFGCGEPKSDKAELQAIEDVFCKNEKKTLRIGSVTSNIGYTEAATGACSITKVVLGYQKGLLAANLHCNSPRRDVASLSDGRMRVLTEHEPFRRTYAAINGISYNGVMSHVLLRGLYKQKNAPIPSAIPYLVTLSGRQSNAVQSLIDDLKQRPIDTEELALLHNIHEAKNSGHLARGYVILDSNKEKGTVPVSESVEDYDDLVRPLWFVYSGMGSQWSGMGADLMRIPTFAAAINRCDKVLKPRGVDIINIITSSDKNMFDNILHSFVGIAAVQIGLTDVLRELGIVPDKIIGHSVGELGCGYADGCFTAEEMILSAYSRGLVSKETSFIRGSMAAVGIGYQNIVKLCPPEIQVACHNGPESSTISGPADAMKEFVAKLTAQGIFAKEVPCSNIAYHSRYIAEAGPKLLDYLTEVIKTPKKRSERWVSTSIPQDRWDEEQTQYCSAWYHTNNLLSPVLFEESSRLVPANAVVVEVAPHGLLQAILKRSLHPDTRHIPLTKRGHSDNALFFLQAIGKLYMQGYNPVVKNLYPKVEFPVSTETPSLSHLIDWNDAEKWPLPLNAAVNAMQSASCKFYLSTHDVENKYLAGHVIKGKLLCPYSAVLVAVWDTLAISLGYTKKGVSVQFRDINFSTSPVLLDRHHTELKVAVHQGTGEFEVLDSYTRIASGHIAVLDNDNKINTTHTEDSSPEMALNMKGVYNLLKERDYFYSGDFRSIYKCNIEITEAELIWNNNWVTLIDGILQLNTLQETNKSVCLPSHIDRLTIDIEAHNESKTNVVDGKTVISTNLSPTCKNTRCGGIVIEKIKFQAMVPNPFDDTMNLQTLKLIPRYQSNGTNLDVMYQVYLQAILEKIGNEEIRVVNYCNKSKRFRGDLLKRLTKLAGAQFNYQEINESQQDQLKNADVIICNNSENVTFNQIIPSNIFIIMIKEGNNTSVGKDLPSDLHLVMNSSNTRNGVTLELNLWKPAIKPKKYVILRTQADIKELELTWNKLSLDQSLVVLASYPPLPGIKNRVRHWRKQSSNDIQLVLHSGLQDGVNPEKLLTNLINLHLAYNVVIDDFVGGEFYVPWKDNIAVERAVSLRCRNVGDLTSMYWTESTDSPNTLSDYVTVRFAGINDLDRKMALGITTKQRDSNYSNSFGMDYSGIKQSGERVMGLVRSGAVRGRVRVEPTLLWPVPEHWSLEDAATVPLAYAQAYYCLAVKTQLLPGMKILVHSGAGALGQAIISIALANQCEVFTTVSDQRKKEFLLELFPGLSRKAIGSSRDHSFGDLVLEATEGQGCDIVISCVSGNLRNTSLKCASYCGITLDTAHVNSDDNYSYGMFNMTKQRSYMTVDIANIFDDHKTMKEIHHLISEGIALGFVRPLTRITYPAHEAARAFRLLASSRHRGRVLLRLRDSIIPVQPKFTCSPDLYQLVLCRDNHSHLQFVDKLVECGAKKILLHCENLPVHLSYKKKSWEQFGVEMTILSENSFNNKSLQTLLNDSFEGIYMIGTKKDSSIVADLDSVSRKLCPNLRHFTIITTDDSMEEYLGFNRIGDHLPATVIYLPDEEKVNTSSCVLLDSIERALYSKQKVLRIQTQPWTPSILEEIGKLANLKISRVVKDTCTLQELGLNKSYSSAISVFLRDAYYIAVAEEEVPTLTVRLLKQYSRKITDSEFKSKTGLSKFITSVGSDEMKSTISLVVLPTRYQSKVVKEGKVDIDHSYLWIVPGLEGHYERFRPLCQLLKIPALVLQPGVNNLQRSFEETAQSYIKALSAKTSIENNRTDFHLLGYELGILSAIEMTSLLEDKGFTGTLFMVGGTADDVLEIFKQVLQEVSNEEKLQDALIRHVVSIISNGNVNIDNVLKKDLRWEDKVNACVQILSKDVTFTTGYMKSIIRATYARIKQALNYNGKMKKLKSRIVIIRPSSTSSLPRETSNMISEKPVSVYDVPSPLEYLAEYSGCASIINENLSGNAINNFESQNHCEVVMVSSVDTLALVYKDEDN